jgi:hypothetical protein
LTFAISQGSCWAVVSIADDVPNQIGAVFGAATAQQKRFKSLMSHCFVELDAAAALAATLSTARRSDTV